MFNQMKTINFQYPNNYLSHLCKLNNNNSFPTKQSYKNIPIFDPYQYNKLQHNCANYNITLMINPNNKYQIQSLTNVPEQVNKKIKQQIEYYFSMANLVTDKNLRRIIQSNNRGWVKIKDLLKFNRLRKIIQSSFDSNVSFGEIEQIIGMAMKDSNRVKVMKGEIKLKKHFNWDRQFKRILYLQGQNVDRLKIVDILSNLNVPQQTVTIRSGQSWHIVQFHNFNEQQINKLHQQITSHFPNIKILKIEQFKQYQTLFNQIFYPLQQENIKKTYKIPPRQLLHYDQIEVKVAQKVAKENTTTKEIDYDRIFSKYIKSRNKKTPEAYQKHRAQKIAQKKQHKIKKRIQKESAMQIE